MSMTKQDMFNKVVNHMRAQGRPKGLGEGQGRGWTYINPDNPCERCAKGILLDTELAYTANKMGMALPLIEISSAINRTLDYSECNMLNDLENMFEVVEESFWETMFSRIAEEHGLHYESPIGKKNLQSITESQTLDQNSVIRNFRITA